MSLFICPVHGLHHGPFCCDQPQSPASCDTHRMAETPKSGSGRSLSGAVPNEDSGDAQ